MALNAEEQARYDALRLKQLRAKKAAAIAASKPDIEELSILEMYKRAPKDAIQMAKNLPGSMYKAGADLVQTVTNPVDTLKAVGGLGESLLKKGQRNVNQLVSGVDIAPKGEEAADAFGKYLKGRYGGLDELRNTVITDPAGAMLDVSSVAIPGGSAARVPAVARVASAVEPVNVLKNALKSAAKPAIPKVLPETMYRNANRLRFPETMSDADMSAALQAGLNAGGIRATEKGLTQLNKITKPLKEQADQIVNDATVRGQQLYADDIFTHFPELRKQKGGIKVEGPKDLAKIQKVEDTIRSTFNGRWGITPREMMDFKTDAYKKVWDKFSGKKKSQTVADIYHTASRGARESLDTALPEVAAINQKLSPLLDLKHPVRKGAKAPKMTVGNVLRKTAPAAASTAMAGLTMSAFGPIPGLAAAAATYLATSPAMKTKMAVALNKIKQGDTDWLDNNLTATQARIALSMAGREEEQETE